MRKLLSFSLFTILSLPFLITPKPVSADGMIMPPDVVPVWETSQKALIVRDENIEHLAISISFSGKAKEFGWVVPLPNKPEISKVESSIFRKLEDLTEPKQNLLQKLKGEDSYTPQYGGVMLDAAPKAGENETTVQVIEEESVGIFDYAILKAEDPNDLKEWMLENNFNLPVENDDYGSVQPARSRPTLEQHQAWSDALPVIQHYIDNGWYFVTIKVNNSFINSSGVEQQLQSGEVDPLLFSFDTTDILYPMRLTALGKRNVTVLLYTLDEGRMAVGNYDRDHCIGDDCSRFTTSYASSVSKDDVNEITKIVGKGNWYEATDTMYVTKLYSSYLPYTEMDEDVLLEKAGTNSGINDGSMSLAEWLQLPIVFVMYIPYLILGGFFNLFGGDFMYWYGLETAWFLFISIAFLVGSIAWLIISSLLLKKTRARTKRILLYVLQFPSVWLVSIGLSMLAGLLVGAGISLFDVKEDVMFIDALACFSFTSILLPVVFYRLMWRKKSKKSS